MKANNIDDFIADEEMVDISGDKENLEKIYTGNSGGKRYSDKKTVKSQKFGKKINDTAKVADDTNQPSADSGKRYKYVKPEDNGDGSQNIKRSKKKIIIFSSAIAAAVLAVVGLAGFLIYNSSISQTPENSGVKETNYVFRFADGTVVSGLSIGNKTFEQAKTFLEENKDKFITPISISIEADGELIQLTEKDFEYTYDIDEVLNEIKNNGADIAGKLKNEDSTSLNINSTVQSGYYITATVTDESIDKTIKKVQETTDKDAVNAHVSNFKPYSDERFTYAEAESGRKLNSDDLNKKIKNFFDSKQTEIRIQAEIKSVEAEIQIDEVKSNIVQLAKYETVSYNTANGTSNMAVSLKACNGSVIEPGEVWSFNKCTGDSNLESNGYLPAHVISDGKLVNGIGGGLCQSSSTIYNAAIRANMEVEERYNHKWASTYVPTGLDATIDYPGLDLKLKNTTDYQMFIECMVYDGNILTASVWGYKSPNYDEITTENKIIDEGRNSYSVEAYRIYIKDGKEVDRESLGKSTYDLDSGHGVVFYNAENDSNAKSVNNKTESEAKKQESSVTENADAESLEIQNTNQRDDTQTQLSAEKQESRESNQSKPQSEASHQETSQISETSSESLTQDHETDISDD